MYNAQNLVRAPAIAVCRLLARLTSYKGSAEKGVANK